MTSDALAEKQMYSRKRLTTYAAIAASKARDGRTREEFAAGCVILKVAVPIACIARKARSSYVPNHGRVRLTRRIMVMHLALRSVALLIVLSITSSARADDAAKSPLAAPPAQLELADGDGIVFLGDSITHQCLYTQYVEDYFYTRYPKLRLRF